MPPRTEEDAELLRLRTEIERMTGRRCISKSVAYLRTRHAELSMVHRGKSAPVDDDPSHVVSASLTRARVALLDRICDEKRLGVSRVMRDAFDEWASRNGYAKEVKFIRSIADKVVRP